MDLSHFLKSKEYKTLSTAILDSLNKVNNTVLNHLIESGNVNSLNHVSIINGRQRVGNSSIYFGIEFVFYSEEVEEFQSNSVNVNFSLRESNNRLIFKSSVDSIYNDIDLINTEFTSEESHFSVFLEQENLLQIMNVVSEFIEKSSD